MHDVYVYKVARSLPFVRRGALAFAEYLSARPYECEADVINPALITIKGSPRLETLEHLAHREKENTII